MKELTSVSHAQRFFWNIMIFMFIVGAIIIIKIIYDISIENSDKAKGVRPVSVIFKKGEKGLIGERIGQFYPAPIWLVLGMMLTFTASLLDFFIAGISIVSACIFVAWMYTKLVIYENGISYTTKFQRQIYCFSEIKRLVPVLSKRFINGRSKNPWSDLRYMVELHNGETFFIDLRYVEDPTRFVRFLRLEENPFMETYRSV